MAAKIAGAELANEGLLALKKGALTEAIAKLERAVGLSPANDSWRFSLAKALLREQRTGEAVEHLQVLCVRDEPKAAWLAMLGTAATKLRRYDEAIGALQKAVGLEQEEIEWRYRLGVALLMADRADEAAAILHPELRPDVPPKFVTLYVRALWRTGKTKTAEDLLSAALSRSDAPQIWLAMYHELKARNASGRSTIDPSHVFYDAIYSAPTEYQSSNGKSHYTAVWERAVNHVANFAAYNVLDLGCGPGQFARFLLSELPQVSYIGVDFSPVAIAIASEACPNAKFVCADALDANTIAPLNYNLIVATEFLEHVVDDTKIFSIIRRGTPFIGSVPNFDSFGHVRHFASQDQVLQRYERFLVGTSVEEVPLTAGASIFLMTGKVA